MSSRRAVIAKITKEAKRQGKTFTPGEEGGRHSRYFLDGLLIPIPRHRTIDEDLARMIYKECEPELGKGWWRR